MQIVQRHHFASHLKRMAVIVRIQDEFFAFVKVWQLHRSLDNNSLNLCSLLFHFHRYSSVLYVF